MGEKIKTFKSREVTSSKVLNIIISCIIISAGLALAFVPAAQNFFNKFITTDKYFIYYITFLVIGAWLLVSTLSNKTFKEINAFSGGITIEYTNKSRDILFASIDYVICYSRKQLQYIQIYIKGQRSPLQITQHQVQDFNQLAKWLEDSHCALILGSDFPNNVATLCFTVAKETKIENGKLYYKNIIVNYGDIKSFSHAKLAQRFYSGYAISIFCTDDSVISLLTEKTQNLVPLIHILQLYAGEGE